MAGENEKCNSRSWRLHKIIIALIPIIFAVLFAYYVIPYIYCNVLKVCIKRRTAEKNILVLTFDDGPGSRLTPAILEMLTEYNTKATFFLLGRNVVEHESIVKQIASSGHEICSHGYDHLNYLKVSPFRAISDIKRGWEAIDKALGKKRRAYPFRPPYGKLNLVCLLYLLVRRVPIFYWTLDSGDTWSAGMRDSRRVATAILSSRVGGAVVLAHDFDRTDEDINKMVLDFVRLALRAAKEKRMKVVTLSELVGRSREV